MAFTLRLRSTQDCQTPRAVRMAASTPPASGGEDLQSNPCGTDACLRSDSQSPHLLGLQETLRLARDAGKCRVAWRALTAARSAASVLVVRADHGCDLFSHLHDAVVGRPERDLVCKRGAVANDFVLRDPVPYR